MEKEQLRRIPKVDAILMQDKMKTLLDSNDRNFVVACVREVLEAYRKKILLNIKVDMAMESILMEIENHFQLKNKRNLKKVINGTGIILHTNLGRAPIGKLAGEAAMRAAVSYTNLEYDCEKGKRGSRHTHIEKLLSQLTGAEAAIVVNNNAGAVLLMLSSVTRGKEVIVSRGELVEIGGSFRVPEMMEESGCFLKEVGTTNKTHSFDYARAIDSEKTGALLKVHTSNFSIEGFTEAVEIDELCHIGSEYNVPVLQDLGSGSIYNLQNYGLKSKETIRDCLETGVDAVSFSGDKLLGGPQAGIILGKKKYIDIMKKHPLSRILRIDKMTLAALEETLRAYINPQNLTKNIPVIGMLLKNMDYLEKEGRALLSSVLEKEPAADIALIEVKGQVGGGAVPGEILRSIAISIKPWNISLETLDENLRNEEISIIGRIYQNQFLLDLRTIFKVDYEYVGIALKRGLLSCR